MENFLSLYFPTFAFDIEYQERAKTLPKNNQRTPMVLSQENTVALASPLAEALGIHSGYSLSLAVAICPQLIVLPYQPKYYCEKLEQIANWLLFFSPLIEIDQEASVYLQNKTATPPNFLNYGALIDMQGSDSLLKYQQTSREKLTQTIINLFRKVNIRASAAWGITPLLAWAKARFKGRLPISALRLEQDIVTQLQELSLNYVDQLEDIPSEDLRNRFGDNIIKRLKELYQIRKLKPITGKKTYVIKESFEEIVTSQQAVVRVLATALNKLSAALLKDHQEAQQVAIKFFIINNKNKAQPIRQISLTSSPAEDPHIVLDLLYPLVESLPSNDGIYKIILTANNIGKKAFYNKEIWEDPQKKRPSYLLDLLKATIGPSKIKQAVFIPNHLPEDSFEYRTMEEVPKTGGYSLLETNITLPFSRPTIIFSPAEKITTICLLPDHLPTKIFWQGQQHSIVSGYGMEIIDPPWWTQTEQTQANQREYFSVQDATGSWLWLYRQKPEMSWFIQGRW